MELNDQLSYLQNNRKDLPLEYKRELGKIEIELILLYNAANSMFVRRGKK